jgi:hypothetical protein
MRRNIIICAVILLCFHKSLLFGVETGYYLNGEYRNNAIDYENIEYDFYRCRGGIFFSEDSSFNLALVYVRSKHEKKCTWNLSLKDISPSFSLVMGNYLINCGYGLLLGRKNPFNPDIFIRKEKSSDDGIVVPVNSGNPSFSFYGLAASGLLNCDGNIFSLYSFYSSNKRYINEDEYYLKKSDSRLSTIQGLFARDYNHTEPIDVMSAGSIISFTIEKMLLLQLYYLYTDIKTASGDEIQWESDTENKSESGTSNLHGIGFFAKYSDDYIILFWESDLSIRKAIFADNYAKNITGFGILYGIKFSHPAVLVSLIRRETASKYYAPFGSSIGEDHPERGWFFDAKHDFPDYFSIGASISAEKKLIVDQADNEPTETRREKCYLKFANSWIKSDFSIIFMQTKNGEESRKKIQYNNSDEIILDIISFKIFLICQKCDNTGYSALMAAGVSLRFFSFLSMSACYCRGIINGNNTIYTIISPLENSSIPGFSINKSSDIIIINLKFRFEAIDFSFRYLHQFVDAKTYQKKIEFVGSAYF